MLGIAPSIEADIALRIVTGISKGIALGIELDLAPRIELGS